MKKNIKKEKIKKTNNKTKEMIKEENIVVSTITDNTEKNVEVDEMIKTETKEETFFEDNKKKSVGKLIFNIIFWALFSCLAFVWIFDFIQVKQGNEPKFCISHKTHTYDDGTVKECTGLGYKVYNYNRASMNIKEQFSPFFIGIEE